MRNKVLFFSAGEISGDIHAADLMAAIKESCPEADFVGLGGQRMREAGLRSFCDDISTLSTMGIFDRLDLTLKKAHLLKDTVSYLGKNPVDAVVLVDNQGFNIPLAKAAKGLGMKVFYYFPPHVSIWGRWNAPKLAPFVDLLLAPFYQDYLVYQEYTKNVYFSGNPLIDKVSEFKKDPAFKKTLGFNSKNKIVTIMPGSRRQEIDTLLPVFLEAARELIVRDQVQILLPVAHPEYEDEIKAAVLKAGLDDQIRIVIGRSYDAMAAADAVILSSGTASLESTLFGKPTVICYQISRLSFFIGKLLVKKQMVGLPNIILDQKAFPELLQQDCNAANIVKETMRFLNMDQKDQARYAEYYGRIKESLGGRKVAVRAAKKILELL